MLGLIGNDKHSLAAVEARNHLIRHSASHVHADQREHCRCHAEQESCHHHNAAVKGENHAAHVQ